MNDDPGLASWLQLTLTPGLGAAALRGLLRQFGLPQEILKKSRSALAPFASASALQALESAEVAKAVATALEWSQQAGHHVVTLADESYPKALLEISDPPAVLYAVGKISLLRNPLLAVVGSRNATAQGELNAESFAKALSERGLTIVS